MLGTEIDAAGWAMFQPRRLIDQPVALGGRERHACRAAPTCELGGDAQQLERQREGRMGGHDDAEMLALEDGLELVEATVLGEAGDQGAETLAIGARVAFSEAPAQALRPIDEGGKHQALNQLLQNAEAELALVQAPADIEGQ